MPSIWAEKRPVVDRIGRVKPSMSGRSLYRCTSIVRRLKQNVSTKTFHLMPCPCTRWYSGAGPGVTRPGGWAVWRTGRTELHRADAAETESHSRSDGRYPRSAG